MNKDAEREKEIEDQRRQLDQMAERMRHFEETLVELGYCCGKVENNPGLNTDPNGGSPSNGSNAENILYQNVPNPFDKITNISYKLGFTGLVLLEIYDEKGTYVFTLVEEDQKPGNYTYSWNASAYPSGSYMYILKQNGKELSRKMLLLR